MNPDIIDVDDPDLEVGRSIIHIDLTPTHIVLDGAADECLGGKPPALKVERQTPLPFRDRPSTLVQGITQRAPLKRNAVFSPRDGPLMKRSRTSGPTPVVSNATSGPSRTPSRPPTNNPHKRKKSPVLSNIMIEISSEDSDDEVCAQLIKRRKHSDFSDSDEESDGFDLHDPDRWKPFSLPDPYVDEVADVMEELKVLPSATRRRPLNITTQPTIHEPPSHDMLTGPYVWNQLRKAGFRPKTPHMPRPTTHRGPSSCHRYPLKHELQLEGMHLLDCYREAPGSINRIIQRQEIIVICSAAIGGQADEEDEEHNPYNRSGSLAVWHNGKMHNVDGHNRTWGGVPEKYYTVNDVKFDPSNSTRLASSGNDKTVCVWTYEDSPLDDSDEADHLSQDVDLLHRQHTFTLPHVPYDLAFKPESSTLAMACSDGKIYICPDLSLVSNHSSMPPFALDVAEPGHVAGAFLWGLEQTDKFLFASSEPPDDGLTGCHKAFDISRRKPVYTLDTKDAGDALCIDPSGDNLALFTLGANRTNNLNIYDIRRQNPRALKSIQLEPFQTKVDGEVNVATFSPDSVYLAVARNDNTTHVYDSRMLERGVLYDFKHRGTRRTNPRSDSYGVVEAQWRMSRSSRLGLVTGGDDGCVRLWDPLQSGDNLENGMIIAETSFDVGTFSLGEEFNHEQPLVVGDGGGGISIFDRRGAGPLWYE